MHGAKFSFNLSTCISTTSCTHYLYGQPHYLYRQPHYLYGQPHYLYQLIGVLEAGGGGAAVAGDELVVERRAAEAAQARLHPVSRVREILQVQHRKTRCNVKHT